MPLSTITITGSWVNPDNTPASGIISLQPIQEATASGTIVAGSPVHIPLVNGSISTVLVNNTQATALQYQVTERITNTALVTYTITPTGSTLDLSTAPRSSAGATPVFILASQLGVAGGVVPLDGTAHIPAQYLPSGSGVLSVTAGDSTITIGGTGADPTVAVNSIPESKVTNLVGDLATLSANVATKATKPTFRRAYITSGDTTLPSTGASWAAVSGFELDIPAVAGDTVEVSMSAMRSQNTSAFLDVGVITGPTPAIQRYLATGSATPAIEGEPDWYTQNTFIGHAGPHSFIVTSNDLDSGNLRIALVCKSNGTGVVYSSTNYPFYWQLINWGSVG
ncbi:hypothetical protein [Actinocrispum wychmicini]|uniref:Uncharacterized protein n=1 Tax=Actinocrispum wychmicini TaxID=1213861 RepID=A0A4V2S6S0_9PSEU|nr:hypothetical protein [Actinocrispum wychmicini]TCO57110.1 hypothetical protein EV192_106587 [Actinocrispum wychmicini]